MAVDIEQLKQLQVLDKEVFDLQEENKEIPLLISDAVERLEAQKSKVAECEESVKAAKLSMSSKELGMKEKEASITKYSGQLSQVKTNKEYSALQNEIANIKADISVIEEEIIGLLDEVQRVENVVKDEQGVLDGFQAEHDAKKKELEEKVKVNEVKIATLDEQKKGLEKDVDPQIFALYDRLVKNKRGQALAEVKGEACGVCRMTLLSQTVNEVMLGENLVFCESCGRILYLNKE